MGLIDNMTFWLLSRVCPPFSPGSNYGILEENRSISNLSLAGIAKESVRQKNTRRGLQPSVNLP
jgi:hypothetical protein